MLFLVIKSINSCCKVTCLGSYGAYMWYGIYDQGFFSLSYPGYCHAANYAVSKGFTEMLKFGGIAIISAASISLPWALAVNQYEPDYWHYFFWVEHIQRFSSEDAQHKAPFWFYIPIIYLV